MTDAPTAPSRAVRHPLDDLLGLGPWSDLPPSDQANPADAPPVGRVPALTSRPPRTIAMTDPQAHQLRDSLGKAAR